MRNQVIWAAVLFAAGLTQGAAQEYPREYARVCNAFSPGYQYIPGTETCVQVDTGNTAVMTENGPVYGKTELAERIDQAFAAAEDTSRAAAVIGALPVPIIEKGHNFAIAGNYAQFESDGAFGLAGAFRINVNTSLNAGVAVGAEDGSVGGRVGLNVSW
jgi:hypothetical protein